MSNSAVSVITVVPLIAFAIISLFAAKTSYRFGLERTIFVALWLILIGVIVRSITGVSWLYIGTILDRKSTRLNSSHVSISYAVFCYRSITYLLSFPTRRSSDLNSAVSVITVVPLIAFAIISLFAAKTSYRFGLERTIFVALWLILIGVIVRSITGVSWLYIGTI